MNKGATAKSVKINEILPALNKRGRIDPFWDELPDPKTEYRLVRARRIVRLGQLKFTSTSWGQKCSLTRDRSRRLAPF